MTTIKPLLLVSLALILLLVTAGCIDKDPNYIYSHNNTAPNYGDVCRTYYENITILDKNQEVVSSGFGSRTRYVVITTDGISREGVSFAVYRELEINKSYLVISSDRKGCGYVNHNVWIESVFVGDTP